MSEKISPEASKNIFPKNRRMEKVFRLASEAMIRLPDVEGLENILEIPPDTQVVFATTHLADLDLPAIAGFLAAYRPIDISGNATNLTDKRQLSIIRYIGIERYHAIKNLFDFSKDATHTMFDPENFRDMLNAVKKGRRDIVIAAHKVTRDWRLPDKPGIGAVYLAQLAGISIIPVVLDIHSDQPVGMAADISGMIRRLISGRRPDATIRIGNPLAFEQLTESKLADVALLMRSRRNILKYNPEQYRQAKETLELIKKDAGLVMESLAALLPESKRGIWGNSLG